MAYLTDEFGNHLVDEFGNLLTDDVIIDTSLSARFSGVSAISVNEALVGSNHVIFSDRVLDLGLTSLATETNALYACSGAPTNFFTALSLRLAQKTGTRFGAPGVGTRGGRRVIAVAITDGDVLTSGSATDWAAVDTVNSRLLANGPLRTARTVPNGGKFTLPPFSLELVGG